MNPIDSEWKDIRMKKQKEDDLSDIPLNERKKFVKVLLEFNPKEKARKMTEKDRLVYQNLLASAKTVLDYKKIKKKFFDKPTKRRRGKKNMKLGKGFVFSVKDLKRFMKFILFYQPKGKRNWKDNCLKEWFGGKKMNKDVAIKLKQKIDWIAEKYSNPDREKNGNNETFSLNKIVPLSEYTAVAFFNKSSEKQALAFLYYVEFQDGYWGYFFLKESHVFGMSKIVKYLQEIEEFNFPRNL
uniref:Uncharacterized protein n=1 Tax=viral metagenome TaxID=1070528 RepID=A0A6M3XXX4_9ZZZZ